MDILDAIYTRRSIRKYMDKEIEEDKVMQLLKAAQYAPTARNLQPWHFIYTQNKQKLIDLSEIHPYGKMLKNAGLAILVCGDKTEDAMDSYLIQNCSAAIQNILLAAHGLELGAVWLGVHPREERMKGIIKYFELPEHILPIGLISIGYPNEVVKQPERYREERVRKDSW